VKYCEYCGIEKKSVELCYFDEDTGERVCEDRCLNFNCAFGKSNIMDDCDHNMIKIKILGIFTVREFCKKCSYEYSHQDLY